MMVIEVDYQGDPRAVAPDLLPEIDLWHMYAFNSKDYPVDRDCIYILPAGYTIDRNVRICEFENRPAEMDVIYPSGKTPCVPLMVQISYSRQPGMRINPGGAYYIFGLLTTGYRGDHGLSRRWPGPGDMRTFNLTLVKHNYVRSSKGLKQLFLRE